MTMADTHEWRSDRLRDEGDDTVRWRPTIPVSGRRTWTGPTVDGPWVVGTPERHVLFTHSPAGVIALLPPLERSMTEVAADLEVTSLTQHSLAFERVVGAALDTRAGGHWTACAITWLKDGFPVTGHTGALRRIITEKKRVDQRSRQTAARLLNSSSSGGHRHGTGE
jgi:hypothetical protein